MKVKAKLRKAPVTKPRPRPVKKPPSRAARMLALAYHIERLIEAGELRDHAAAARRLGLTRARVTQVMNLLSVPVPIQEALLLGEVATNERRLREASAGLHWEKRWR